MPIRRNAAAWHDAVQVGMVDKGLSPAVQHRDHAGLGAQMLGIAADDRTVWAAALNRIS